MKESQSPPRQLPVGLNLEEGETVVRDEIVSVITGWLAQFSRLILTDQRLIFVPLSSPLVLTVYDVRLAEVADVAPGSFLARLRLGKFLGYPEAVVALQDGKMVRFRATSATAWIDAIRSLLNET
jgi:hypothetical protein